MADFLRPEENVEVVVIICRDRLDLLPTMLYADHSAYAQKRARTLGNTLVTSGSALTTQQRNQIFLTAWL